ncbi:MAG TPA: transglutaminase domain-containing protein [Thermoanaerobaculia bacterium]|nr:transglutaminase domain-containing protein [Thermoanaerobaculia bacterium]HUM29027.1 transglutaminase domain-containing protein [Thermoanaerobaculia bacterium]HXK67417.1 transglutaminase domain-containing protein [Thermoanaerobaculia bacterium]
MQAEKTMSYILRGMILLIIMWGGSLPAGEYQAIDQWAAGTPPEVTRRIDSLAFYLITPAKNDNEKARALYTWITNNLSYDLEGLLHSQRLPVSAEDVLKTRKAVCGGFANLFERLATEAGLEAVTIRGFSKGYGYQVGQSTQDQTNHAWNAVRIDGAWKLIDVTWGSGYLDETGTYVRRFEDFYFLARPEALILTHFPEDPAWQLLTPPVTREEFERFVYVKPPLFHYGIELDSHTSASLRVSDQLLLHLRVPEEIILTSSLLSGDREVARGYIFSQRNRDGYDIHVLPPHVGVFTLRIFSRPRDSSGILEWTLDYRIEASPDKPADRRFPLDFEPFHTHAARLISPFFAPLAGHTTQNFKIFIPEAMEVIVLSGAKRHFLVQRGELFEGKVRLTSGDVTVYAKFRPGNLYEALLTYPSGGS